MVVVLLSLALSSLHANEWKLRGQLDDCKRRRKLTKVELAVDLLTVDDVELVRHAGVHVAHFEVEPLVMVVRVDVAVEYQVILIVTHLHNHRHTTLHRTTSNSPQISDVTKPVKIHIRQMRISTYNNHHHYRFTALFPGPPG